MPRSQKTGSCALCARSTHLSFHHLIPRKVHRRARFRKRYDRSELARGIAICHLCHRGIHRLFDEMTLGSRLNTLEALLKEPAIVRHVAWVRKQRTPNLLTRDNSRQQP